MGILGGLVINTVIAYLIMIAFKEGKEMATAFVWFYMLPNIFYLFISYAKKPHNLQEGKEWLMGFIFAPLTALIIKFGLSFFGI